AGADGVRADAIDRALGAADASDVLLARDLERRRREVDGDGPDEPRAAVEWGEPRVVLGPEFEGGGPLRHVGRGGVERRGERHLVDAAPRAEPPADRGVRLAREDCRRAALADEPNLDAREPRPAVARHQADRGGAPDEVARRL